MSFIRYVITGIPTGFMAGKTFKGIGFGPMVKLAAGITAGVPGGWMFRNVGTGRKVGMLRP